jgi:hypothetical protein
MSPDQLQSWWKTRGQVTTAAILLLAGCTSAIDRDEAGQLLAHRVAIPREFSWGAASPHFPSSAWRYLNAYDQAWWACIRDFAQQIDYQPTVGDRAGNGWPPAIAGYSDGYSSAEARVKEIKVQYGDRKAQTLLKESLEFPP